MEKIGFATEFYTLWDVRVDQNYFTDAYGNSHPSGTTTYYTYYKNISKDIDKVKALYPNTPIDESLRGKTRSFEQSTKLDLPANILSFGKYIGQTIEDVVKKDFNYILWVIDNNSGKTKKACLELPEVKSYFEQKEAELKAVIDSLPMAVSGINTVTFYGNPNRKVNQSENFPTKDIISYSYDTGFKPLNETGEKLIPYLNKHYAVATIGDGNNIYIIFDDVKEVSGIYPFNMGVINGIPKKLKNKSFELNLEILYTKKYAELVEQIAIIKNK